MKAQRELVKRGLAAGFVTLATIGVTAAIRRRRRAVQFFKSLSVAAPADAVYDFWTRFENFPGCFPQIRDVRRTGEDNEWQWTMVDAKGQAITWKTWVTESIPNRSIAWESAPNAEVRSAGVVQFSDSGYNSTRVDVRMSYKPCSRQAAGALKAAFGRQPQKTFEESLYRLQAKFDSDIPAINNNF